MKKTPHVLMFLLALVISSGSLFAQKTIAQYSVEELKAKKAEAEASKANSDAAVYDAALMLRDELANALKVEDYDKATAIQEQLKALKLKPSTAQQEKQIQEEINKAVAAEDYDKAQQLKKQLEDLHNQGNVVAEPKEVKAEPAPAPAPVVKGSSKATKSNSLVAVPVENAPVQSAPAPSQSAYKSSSSLSKNDIYGSGVTYMGIDFSLITLASPKKVGQEQKLNKYIGAWQKAYVKDIQPKKLAHWMAKTELNDESANVENLYSQNLNRAWIVTAPNAISQTEIEAQLKTYKSSHQGIALVMIPGPFDEKRHELTLNVVWFDLGSRTIVSMQSISARATSWPGGLIAATKDYVDKYYKKRQ